MYILLFTFATVRHGSREKEWAHQHCEVFPAVAQISIENEQRNISENQYIISSNMDVDSCNMSTESTSFQWCFEVGLDLLYIPE